MLFKICKKKNKNGRFVFASQMTRTCLNVRLGSLASPPVMSYKPILFLAHRPAVKRCLALAAPFELKRALLPPSAFCVVAHLKQNIPFASLHDLLQLLSANQLSTTLVQVAVPRAAQRASVPHAAVTLLQQSVYFNRMLILFSRGHTHSTRGSRNS